MNFPPYPIQRPRRLRRTPEMRRLVRETLLSPQDFIYPIFVRHGRGDKRPIASMPGQFQLTLDDLAAEIKEMRKLGLQYVMPFGVPEHKDAQGSDNLHDNGIVQQAIRIIKDTAPEMLVISDICLCDYSDHGHCTIIDPSNNHMLNEPTLAYLQKAAISHVKAGADMVAPSGMIDGMVQAIRGALNESGYVYTPIMSYAVKYASCFYAPFRDAAECAPKFGTRDTYQLDAANGREAIKEVALDINEGADIVMVKPALPYLDVIKSVSERFDVPVAAYQVSGEYAMLMAASQNGWLDLRKSVLESLTCIKRAGATMTLTYFAKDAARWLQE
jgi:porphobilinogen synthase